MILVVRQRVETLDRVGDALAALIGCGLVQMSSVQGGPPIQDPLRVPPCDAIEVTCDVANGGFVKAGFYAAGFEVPGAAGPAHDPGDNNPVTLTITPAAQDTVQNYPIGIGDGAIMAAKALCGAYVTRTIGPNNDPYIGDNPDTSIQVRCNRADVPRVQGAFAAAKFNAGLLPDG